MDKRQNKKNNKNKHKQSNNNNSNSSATPSTTIPGNNKHNNRKFEQPVQQKLSNAARQEMKDLISTLLQTVYKEAGNPKAEWEQYVTVQQLLQRIQVLEEPLKRKPKADGGSQRLANIEKFYQWAKEKNISYEGLEIAAFEGYDLGLKATRDIKKDDILFGIPKQVILSEEHLECSFARDFFKLSNLKLAFVLMVESLKPDSLWKPYLDLLPESYNTVLYYSIEDMEKLKGSNALSTALKQCHLIARQYAIIYHWPSGEIPMADFKQVFNYDLYRWAVSTVMTRENLIPRSQPKREGDVSDTIAALIPFWDMANHSDGAITTFFNMATNQIESSAQADFKKDEQIFIYYGDRSNADLMIHNGFINPSNSKDSVSIKLGLSPTDKLFGKRGKLLELLGISKTTELKVLPNPNYISAGLLAFVRVFNMNEEQLDHWNSSDRAMDLLHIDCALETELEMKTWQYLQTRLMLLLRVFPTSIEEDEKLLKDPKANNLTAISEMIIQYRLLEKRILSTALEYAKERSKA